MHGLKYLVLQFFSCTLMVYIHRAQFVLDVFGGLTPWYIVNTRFKLTPLCQKGVLWFSETQP